MRNSVILCLLFSTQVCNADYTVGLALRFDDKFNSSVSQLVNGMEIATNVYEKTNKIKINLKRYSHGENMEDVFRVTRLIIKDKIPFVIGGENSNEALVMAKTLNSSNIVFLTPTSSHPDVTKDLPNSFRVCFSDDQVADKMATFIVENLKAKTIGVVHNVSEPYPNYLGGRIYQRLTENKSLAVLSEKTIQRQLSYRPIVEKFKKAGVTHVAMFNYAADFFRFVDEASKENYFPVYVGSDGWGSNEKVQDNLNVKDDFGHKFVGYRNVYWNSLPNSPMAANFIKLYEKRFHEKPTAWSAIGFDTAWIAFTAIKNSHYSHDSQKVTKSLKLLHELSLVTAKNFRFSTNNSPDRKLVIYKLSHEGTHYQGEY